MSKFLDLDGLDYFANKVKTDILSIENYGSRNELIIDKNYKIENNVTFVTNNDKSITITTNQAASADTTFDLTNGYVVNNLVGKILSGANENTNNNICIYISYKQYRTSSEELANATIYNGSTETIQDYPYIKISIKVVSGVNLSTPVTMYPMICPLSLWNQSHRYSCYQLSDYLLYNRMSTIFAYLSYVGYNECIYIKKADNEGRVRFYFHAVYNGTETFSAGVLASRTLPYNEELTVDNCEADIAFGQSSMFHETQMKDKLEGLGISIRPYIIVNGERRLGIQQRVFWEFS